jgi:hypothetical protein
MQPQPRYTWPDPGDLRHAFCFVSGCHRIAIACSITRHGRTAYCGECHDPERTGDARPIGTDPHRGARTRPSTPSSPPIGPMAPVRPITPQTPPPAPGGIGAPFEPAKVAPSFALEF